jgi:clan AA aspartic protease
MRLDKSEPQSEDCGERGEIMGHVYAEITLQNSFEVIAAEKGLIPNGNVKKLTVTALVDSGAMTLTINEEIAKQLNLPVREQFDVTLANGSRHKCDYAGPVDIRFENRFSSCNALVLPGADEILLGVIPLEEMDVIIDPRTQQLVVHPDRPDCAGMKVK